MNSYTILAYRRPEAEAMLAKFVKKAARYGVEFGYMFGWDYSAKERMPRWDRPGYEFRAVRRIDVVLWGQKPTVGDYEFLAHIERTSAGNFVDTVPGMEADPEWRTTDSRCDHCGTSRKRKNVYMVRNRISGDVVQVGRTCLRDFLGIDDPKSIINNFKFARLVNALGEEDEWLGLGSYPWSMDLRWALRITCSAIRQSGWVSKGAARMDVDLIPTVNAIWFLEGTDGKERAEREEFLDEMKAHKDADTVTVDTVIEWVRGGTQDADYFHNLRVAFGEDVLLDERRVGLAISAIASWHREKERELTTAARKAKTADAKWVGEKGERLRDMKVRLTMKKGMGDNGYGYTELLKFEDAGGNVFTWFTGSAGNWDIGDEMMLTGTVKQLREYQGAKETQLTRCNVVGG